MRFRKGFKNFLVETRWPLVFFFIKALVSASKGLLMNVLEY